MWSSIIAVAGTLLGAIVAGTLQRRAARAGRQEERAATLRRDQLDAVTALAVAVSDHRRAMWELRSAQLTGADEERVRQLRDASHETRSEITAPAVRVRLLIEDQAVREAATLAIQATYEMREATGLQDLEAMRSRALGLHGILVDAMAAFLTRTR